MSFKSTSLLDSVLSRVNTTAWVRGFFRVSNLGALILFLVLGVISSPEALAYSDIDVSAAPFKIPEKLKAWASSEHATRYFLKVEAPPLAGAIGLQMPPSVAHIYLPLKTFKKKSAEGVSAGTQNVDVRIENILLLGSDATALPVFLRKRKGSSDVEVAFSTRTGYRRYCLYVNAPDGYASKFSPPTFRPSSLQVKIKGVIAPSTFVDSKKDPITPDRFQELLRRPINLREKKRPLIDDPEGPLKRSQHPNYACAYEGFLRAPVTGTYEFAVGTYGMAILVVDGEQIISMVKGDPLRKAFSLRATKKLGAGTHRVTLFHAQAGQPSGVRLYWRPPFAKELLIVPAHAFCRALPALLTGVETSKGTYPGFIHLEQLGHCRTTLHRGSALIKEWVLVAAQTGSKNSPHAGTMRFSVAGKVLADVVGTRAQCWTPAGREVTVEWLAPKGVPPPESPALRMVRYPTKLQDARFVMDITGEMSIQDATKFIYPNERGEVHLEFKLSPLPVIHPKARVEKGPALPRPIPYGEYRIRWKLDGPDTSISFKGEHLVTPDLLGRSKVRVPFQASRLQEAFKSGKNRLTFSFYIGGLPIETIRFRLVHARGTWPEDIKAGLSALEISGESSTSGNERVMILVPREKEVSYRRFQILRNFKKNRELGHEILFLGDPLVEVPAGTPGDEKIGLVSHLVKALPKYSISSVTQPGPHRGWFIFRVLAETERWLQQAGEGAVPKTAVISLGGADASLQTPLFHFERGVDVLIDRLRIYGVKRIIVLGVLPEPGRARQARHYLKLMTNIASRHHLEHLDIFTPWTAEKNWTQRFALDPKFPTTLKSVPNSQSLKEIILMLKKSLLGSDAE